MEQDAHQVACLVRAGDVAGFVLHPHLEPELFPQCRLAVERCGAKPVAVDGSDPVVQAAHQLDELRVAHSARARRVPGVEALAVAHERVLVIAWSSTEPVASRCARTWSPSSLPRSHNGTGPPRRRPAPSRSRRRPAATGSRRPAGTVECRDHRVPGREELEQALPEALARARVELLERDALLLDPGEVAEIEDALAVARCASAARGRWTRRASAGRRSRPHRPHRSVRRNAAQRPSASRCVHARRRRSRP